MWVPDAKGFVLTRALLEMKHECDA
jgi:hypothetical protein